MRGVSETAGITARYLVGALLGLTTVVPLGFLAVWLVHTFVTVVIVVFAGVTALLVLLVRSRASVRPKGKRVFADVFTVVAGIFIATLWVTWFVQFGSLNVDLTSWLEPLLR